MTFRGRLPFNASNPSSSEIEIPLPPDAGTQQEPPLIACYLSDEDASLFFLNNCALRAPNAGGLVVRIRGRSDSAYRVIVQY